MNQNKIIAFFIFLFLGFVFIILTLLVWLSRGKNKFFIAKKIKIGTRIIMITAFLSFISFQSCPPIISCYDPIPNNQFIFEQTNDDYQIVVSASGDRILYGTVSFREVDAFTFHVLDSNDSILQQGDVLPSDGVYDSDEEEVEIHLSESLLPGTYQLIIMNPNNTEYPIYSNTLIIM